MRLLALVFIVALTAGCARRYRTTLEPACPPAKDSTIVRVQRGAGGSIQGEVVDRDSGRPLLGGALMVTPSRMIGTDTLGRFVVTGLTPGRYIIRTRQIGYEEHTDTVVVTASAGAHLHLVLTPQYFDRCMEMRTVRTLLPWWRIG